MSPRHHAMLLPVGPDMAAIEALRRAWDPVMASRIAGHVTALYPDQHPGLATLQQRVREVAARTRPFRLTLGGFRAFPPPDEDCVYIEVADPDGGFAVLRDALAAPPFQRFEFPPHLTVIHPRTSSRADAFWRAALHRSGASEVMADSIVVTSSDPDSVRVEARYALG